MSVALDALLSTSKALNICRVPDGQWQASLETSPGSFRVRIAPTPEEAVRALVLVRPCPVPAI